LGGLLGPLLVMSSFLIITRHHIGSYSEVYDYVAFAGAVFLGVICIYGFSRSLGWGWPWVIEAVIAYAVVTSVSLFFYSFELLCAILRECL
jgi:hypothetical protein